MKNDMRPLRRQRMSAQRRSNKKKSVRRSLFGFGFESLEPRLLLHGGTDTPHDHAPAHSLDAHIHASLHIFVDGQQVAIPANIGVDESGFLSFIHTHDADNVLHIHPINNQSPSEFITLGDFFDTWRTNAGAAGNNPNAVLSENQILNNLADSQFAVRMFVNGVATDQFEDYVIHEGDRIVLSYSSQPIVTLNTNFGPIVMELFADATPQSVDNFLNYVNDGDYINSIFHRSVSNFVVQGGGFTSSSPQFTNAGQFVPVPTDPAVQNEPGISNLRGTVAMAKLGGDPHSATSQFFVNLGDNSENLDAQNGGFTVFGRVLDMTVVDAIAALNTTNAGGAFSELPLSSTSQLVQVQSVAGEGTVRGTVYEDTNRNATRDAGEAGLGGFTIFVDANNNGQLDSGEISITTASDGSYFFRLPAGTYTIREQLPENRISTQPVGGVGRYTVEVEIGREVIGRDFGSQEMLVEFRMETTDLGGNPSSAFVVGDAFLLNVYVQDLRPPAEHRGVVTAFLDLLYNSDLVSTVAATPTPPENFNFVIEFGPQFNDPGFTKGSDNGNGLIDEVGSIQNGFGIGGLLGSDEVLLFTVRFVGMDAGTAAFTGDPPDLQANDVTFGEPPTTVPGGKLSFVGTSVQIVSGTTAVNDTLAVLQGSTANTLNVLANDIAGSNATLTITSFSQISQGGSVTIASNGTSLIYSPASDFIGTETFTYEIADGLGGTSSATASVQVLAADSGPVAVDDTFTVLEDTFGVVLQVLDNDIIPPDSSATLAITAVGATNHGGQVTISASGSQLVYTPVANFFGTETFTYTISDGEGGTDTATVTVHVTPVNDNPVAVNDAFTVTKGSANNALNVLANDSDIDGDTLTITAVGTPNQGGTVTIASNNLTLNYTAAANFSGTETFTYTISDGQGGTAQATVTMTVPQTPGLPDAVNNQFTHAKDSAPQTLHVLANDTLPTGSSGALTITQVTQGSAGGTVVITTNGTRIQYTSASGFTGTETFTYTISDGNGGTDQATVTVSVVDDVNAIGANSLSGFVYVDSNNDGVKNGSELGIGGVTVTLTGTSSANAAVSLVQVTAADGSYRFNNLEPGNYTITQTQPLFMIDGRDTIGSQGGTATVNDAFSIQLTPNTHGVNNNFGELGREVQFVQLRDFFARQPSESLLVAASTNGPMWYSGTNGWEAFQSVQVTLSQDRTSVQVTAVDHDQVAHTATVPLNDTTRVRILGQEGNNYLFRLEGSLASFGLVAGDGVVAQNDAFTVNQGSTNNSLNVLANDVDQTGGQLTITAVGTASQGGTVTIASDGTSLNYTPLANFFGAETFTYTVQNATGQTAQASVTMTVTQVNNAPVAVNDVASVNRASTNNVLNVLANDTNPAGGQLTITAVGTTSQGGTVTIASGGQSLLYTPLTSFTGTETFTYTVQNSAGLTAQATVTVTVNFVNTNPIAVNDAFTVGIDSTSNSLNVLANDTDADGDPLTITTLGTPSQGGTVTIATDGKSLQYAPAADFAGTETFTYTISDGQGGTATATVTVTVADLDGELLAVDDQFIVDENADEVILDVLANDVLGTQSGAALTITAVGATNQGGTVAISTDGAVLVYTPAEDFTGTETFTYTISDGLGGTSQATVTIQVQAVNHPPVALADSYNATKHSLLSVAAETGVLANDVDPDDDPLTVTGFSATSTLGATVVVNADGSFTYDPRDSDTLQALAIGATAVDTFTYTISDGHGGTATATVSITVEGVNAPPVAANDSYATDEDTLLNVAAGTGVLANDSDLDGHQLTVIGFDATTTLGAAVTVNADGSFSYDPQNSATLQALGEGDTVVDTFTYTISDGHEGTATATVSITVTGVNDAPVAVNDTALTNEDSAVAIDVLANDTDVDSDLDPATMTVTVNPANGTVSIDQVTGAITYTPNAGFTGTDTFQYTVADDAGAVSNTATVTVTVNAMPVAVDDSYATDEDTPLNVTAEAGVLLNDTDDNDDSLTVTDFDATSTQGASVVVNADGSFSYDPQESATLQALGEGDTVVDTFTYTISDGRGGTATATVSITVTGVNDAPVAVDDTASTDEDIAVSIDVLANDTDVDSQLDPASVAITVQPTNGTVSIDPVTGAITYTPDAGFTGTDTFAYTVADEEGAVSNEATVSVTVAVPNSPPVAGDDSYAADADALLSVDAENGVLANDTDADDDDLTVTDFDATSTLGAAVVVNADGSFTYDPRDSEALQALLQDETLVDTFTYTVSDGQGGTATATVSITVTGSNTAPVAVDDHYATDEDTPLNIAAEAGVLLNDSDADDDPLTVTDFDSTSTLGASVVINADGSFSYDPQSSATLRALGEGDEVVDTFSYTVSDGRGGTATATVSVTVTGINDAPLAEDDDALTNEDVAVDIDVLANDTDVDSDLNPATVTVTVNPANGTVSVDPVTGVITYTPAAGFTGTDTFNYTVADAEGAVSNEAAVTVTVNALPVAVDDSYAANEDALLSVPAEAGVLFNDTDADGDSLIVADFDATSTLGATVLIDADGSFTYDPRDSATIQALAQDETAVDTFTYTISDGRGGTAVATVSVTVTGVNTPPVAVDDSYATDEDTVLNISAEAGVLANDTDVDSETLTVVEFDATSALGAEVSVNADGSFSYNPQGSDTLQALAAGELADDTFTYTVSDGQGGTATATVTIAITGVNDAPLAADDAALTSEETAVEIDVLANDTDVDSQLDPTSVDITVQPTNGTLTVDPITGAITYTPDAAFTGTDTFAYTVADAEGAVSNEAIVTVTVNAVPLAVDDSYAADEDALLSVPAETGVLVNDTDADGDPLSVTDFDATSTLGATVAVDADGSFTYDPRQSATLQALIGGETAVDTFTYTISDGQGGTATATVSVTVTGVNTPPVAADDAALTNEETAVDIDVLANDTDVDSALDPTSVVITVQPTDGTVSVDPVTGAITYTPDAGFSGTDTFAYTVADDEGAVSNEATVTVTVNANPVAVDDSYAADEDALLSVPAETGVLVNDTDADGDTLTVTGFDVTSALGATVTVEADGSFTYDPRDSATIQALAQGETADDTFTYTISDGQGGTATATVNVTVTGVNTPPVAVDDSYATDENTLLDVAAGAGVLVNDTDVDSATLTVTSYDALSTLGAEVFVNADGSFEYNPQGSATLQALSADETADDTFTYTISDGDGGTATATVTITVTGINDAPVAVDDAASTNEEDAVEIDVLANDTDVDSQLDPTSVDITFQPSDGTVSVDPVTGVITYTPDAGFTGTDTFSYTVADAEGAVSNEAIVTVTVNAVPVAVDDSYATDQDVPLSVPAETGVLVNDTDADGDELTVTDFDATSTLGATVAVEADGSFTYDASDSATLQALEDGETAVDTFTYTITDGQGGTATATVSVTVTGVNIAPVAVDDEATTTEDIPVNIPVLDNDTDVDSALDPTTVTVVSQPSNGTVFVDPDSGVILYIPNDEFFGTDSFTYTVQDAHGAVSNEATVSVLVAQSEEDPEGEGSLLHPVDLALSETDDFTSSASNHLAGEQDADFDEFAAAVDQLLEESRWLTN